MGGHTSLERRYLLQAFWEDFEDALPKRRPQQQRQQERRWRCRCGASARRRYRNCGTRFTALLLCRSRFTLPAANSARGRRPKSPNAVGRRSSGRCGLPRGRPRDGD